MENIFNSYSKDNINGYRSYDYEYLQMYSRHIQKDLLHRCDFITAISYSKFLLSYLNIEENFTNSNMYHLDTSTCSLFGCSDIDSSYLSMSITSSGVKFYNFHIHIVSSNGIDFDFTALQFVVFPTNNENAIQSKINIYGLPFRAEKISNFSIYGYLLYLLFGSGIFDGNGVVGDFGLSEDVDLEKYKSIFPFLSVLFEKYPQLEKSLQNNLRSNFSKLIYFMEYYITRFDYCFDFFMKKGTNCIDFHRLFRGKDFKFTPYTGGSVEIPSEYKDYIHFKGKHMDTGWLYSSKDGKGTSVRCYDKQIKIIENGENDFYSEYMDIKYKIRRLEFEFHSNFCCPCNKITGYDGKVSLLSEFVDHALDKRVLQYLGLEYQEEIFYKKYPVVVNWENRTYIGKYRTIKKFNNLLEYFISQNVPVSYLFLKFGFSMENIEKFIDMDSSESSKISLKDKKIKNANKIKPYKHKLKLKIDANKRKLKVFENLQLNKPSSMSENEYKEKLKIANDYIEKNKKDLKDQNDKMTDIFNKLFS